MEHVSQGSQSLVQDFNLGPPNCEGAGVLTTWLQCLVLACKFDFLSSYLFCQLQTLLLKKKATSFSYLSIQNQTKEFIPNISNNFCPLSLLQDLTMCLAKWRESKGTHICGVGCGATQKWARGFLGDKYAQQFKLLHIPSRITFNCDCSMSAIMAFVQLNIIQKYTISV